MAKIPAYDGRLVYLGEAKDLLEYAKEMQELLKFRWAQRETRLTQQGKKEGWDQFEWETEVQAEEYQHSKYELYLDGQLVISAWSLLEGSVKYCASFLAEHLNIKTRMESAAGNSAEEKWQEYYESHLDVEWPLKSDMDSIQKLRRLRNDYGHELFFEPYAVRIRLEKIIKGMSDEQIDLYYRIGEFEALKGQGVPASELAFTLVEKLKARTIFLFPHDGASISFWERKK